MSANKTLHNRLKENLGNHLVKGKLIIKTVFKKQMIIVTSLVFVNF